jgi:hypothetical protein
MVKLENKEFQKKEYFLLFVLALLPRLIFVALHHYPFRTPMDEMSTFASAAFGAGYDWTPLVSNAKFYYGGGFTILLSPLLRLIDNPELLFGIVLSIYAVLQSISAPIACYISKNYMKIENKSLLYLISLASSYFVVARTQTTLNEHVLISITWCIAFVLCKLIEHENSYGKKAIDTVILFVLMSYALTIHTRTKMYWIVIVMVVILYYLMEKKWLVAKIPAIISGGAGYLLAQKFIDWIKRSVWLWEEGITLKNTSVNIDITPEMLKTPEFYQGTLSTIVGQVHTSLTFTCGLTAIAIVCVAVVVWRYLKKIPAKGTNNIPAEENYMKYILVLMMFFTLCICGTIFAQSLTWSGKVLKALNGENGYGFKAYTYIRYYGIYLGPLLFSVLGYVYYHMEEIKKNIGWMIRIFVAFEFLFGLMNLPYIAHNNVASEVYWPFGLWSEARGDTVRLYVYLMGVGISTIIFGFYLWSLWKKRYKPVVAVMLAVMLFQYGWNAYFWDGHYVVSYEDQTDGAYAFLQELEESGYELPQNIYVKSTASMGQTTAYIYQFLFKEHTIVPKIPKKSEENIIVLCNEPNIKKVQKKGYTVYAIDDNEYIATNSQEVLSFINEKGLKVTK